MGTRCGTIQRFSSLIFMNARLRRNEVASGHDESGTNWRFLNALNIAAKRSSVWFQNAFRDAGNALLDFLDGEVLVEAAGVDGG